MKKWIQKLIEWIKKQFKDEEKQVDTPEPTPAPTSSDVERQYNFAHTAKIVASMELITVNQNGVFFSANKRKWKVVDGCDGEAHLFVRRDGRWAGGKFDHIRPNSTSRDWNNIHPKKDAAGNVLVPPYGVWATLGEPKIGETVAMMAISYDKKERTNAIFFAWV